MVTGTLLLYPMNRIRPWSCHECRPRGPLGPPTAEPRYGPPCPLRHCSRQKNRGPKRPGGGYITQAVSGPTSPPLLPDVLRDSYSGRPVSLDSPPPRSHSCAHKLVSPRWERHETCRPNQSEHATAAGLPKPPTWQPHGESAPGGSSPRRAGPDVPVRCQTA